MRAIQHKYIERGTGRIRVEQLYGDGILKYLYSEKREEPGLVLTWPSVRIFLASNAFSINVALT